MNEVLHFVEFLMTKPVPENSHQEDGEWSRFSLSTAMRDLENEDEPKYDKSDLKDEWK